ncbi:MAG: DUF4202 domain-containing protein [bacterium]|nr:DUF4202 domain-containing protein [bacterium]
MSKLLSVFDRIDEINSEDPNKIKVGDKEEAKELIYGQRMTEMLKFYNEESSEVLQIAARGQHIKRWMISRDEFSMDRKGYLKWRTQLKLKHAEILSEIMQGEGYGADEIERVATLVTKKKLKTDDESKELEDVVCLVFLKYYFGEFIPKHGEEKVIDIVRKTWGKMTAKGHELALQLPLTDEETSIVQKALN